MSLLSALGRIGGSAMLGGEAGAAAGSEVPVLGNVIGGAAGTVLGGLAGAIPEIIGAFQAKSPEQAQAAIQPHLDALEAHGIPHDQAMQMLQAELQQQMEPEHHPLLDMAMMAIGGHMGRKLAGRFMAPFPTRPGTRPPSHQSTMEAGSEAAQTIKSEGPSAPREEHPEDQNPAMQVSSGGGATAVDPEHASASRTPLPPPGFDENAETMTDMTPVTDLMETTRDQPLNLTGAETMAAEDFPTSAFPR